MNDDAHGLLDRALPEGRVPFHIDADQIVRRGRRVRRRRAYAAAAGIAGVVALGMVVTIVGLSPNSAADHGTAAAENQNDQTDSWADEGPWELTRQDPFTNHDTAAAATGVIESLEANPDVTVYPKDVDAKLGFGRYTETSPSGDLDRELLRGEGRYSVDGSGETTKFEVSIYEPGLVDSVDAFVDCEAERVRCSDQTGPDGEQIITRNSDTVSGDLKIRTFEVYVYRADKSVAKLTARPVVDASTDASGVVTTPLSINKVRDVALEIPQNLKT